MMPVDFLAGCAMSGGGCVMTGVGCVMSDVASMLEFANHYDAFITLLGDGRRKIED